MLGAQALRTKQKAEQKEKEKRHRERIRNLELQRERIQRAANEDAAAMQATTAATDNREFAPFFPDPHVHAGASMQQRHTVHATAFPNHMTPLNIRDIQRREKMPQRSPSTDCGKAGVFRSRQNSAAPPSGGNRFMKWLGLSSSSSSDVRKQQRRMSTY